jgi:hypothetical protein
MPLVVGLLASAAAAQAETGAPAVHWGALAYPDQSPTVALTGNFNRFTEFNGEGRRFNNIRETMGFNFASISWTEHWRHWEHWSTNLTVGAGPTGNQPTGYLQNEFIHDTVWGIPKVPIDRLREETDFMIDGSLTRWIDLAHGGTASLPVAGSRPAASITRGSRAPGSGARRSGRGYCLRHGNRPFRFSVG